MPLRKRKISYCLCVPCSSDMSIFGIMAKQGNSVKYGYLTPEERVVVMPVDEIETDLQKLFDAGISPSHVNADVVNPTNPYVQQENAMEKLSQIALSIPEKRDDVNVK